MKEEKSGKGKFQLIAGSFWGQFNKLIQIYVKPIRTEQCFKYLVVKELNTKDLLFSENKTVAKSFLSFFFFFKE